MILDIDNLVKEINDLKAVLIVGDPTLVDLFTLSAEEITEKFKKSELTDIAKLLDVKTTGKELDMVKRMIEAYNKLGL